MPDHHPTGLKLGRTDTRCKECSWAQSPGNTWTCVAADPSGEAMEIAPDWRGCELWEPPIESCDPCGACCREAYDSVPVSKEDIARINNSSKWVQCHADGWRDLRREPSPTGAGTRCCALYGTGTKSAPYRCHIYEDRPTNCRDLEIGSEGCLMARRRVALSPWHPKQSPQGPWAAATARSNASGKKPG